MQCWLESWYNKVKHHLKHFVVTIRSQSVSFSPWLLLGALISSCYCTRDGSLEQPISRLGLIEDLDMTRTKHTTAASALKLLSSISHCAVDDVPMLSVCLVFRIPSQSSITRSIVILRCPTSFIQNWAQQNRACTKDTTSNSSLQITADIRHARSNKHP